MELSRRNRILRLGDARLQETMRVRSISELLRKRTPRIRRCNPIHTTTQTLVLQVVQEQDLSKPWCLSPVQRLIRRRYQRERVLELNSHQPVLIQRTVTTSDLRNAVTLQEQHPVKPDVGRLLILLSHPNLATARRDRLDLLSQQLRTTTITNLARHRSHTSAPQRCEATVIIAMGCERRER